MLAGNTYSARVRAREGARGMDEQRRCVGNPLELIGNTPLVRIRNLELPDKPRNPRVEV